MKRKDGFCATPRRDGRWSVKRTGTNYVRSIHQSQTSAWKETRRLARGEGSNAVLIDRQGEIETQNSYLDNSPYPEG